MALPTRVQRGQYYDPFEAVQSEFNNLLGRVYGNQRNDGNFLAPYAVDVREDGDHIYVEAELPGFKKEEVDVTLENQTLTISAERREQSGGGGQKKGGHPLPERGDTPVPPPFPPPPPPAP